MSNFFPLLPTLFPASPAGVTPPAGARADWRDTPAPLVVCNFPMEVVQGSDRGHTRFNGATRQIPGTHSHKQEPPSLEDEPRYMKLMTTAPAPAGTACLRDTRAWHAGTPNLGRHVRCVVRRLVARLRFFPWIHRPLLTVLQPALPLRPHRSVCACRVCVCAGLFRARYGTLRGLHPLQLSCHRCPGPPMLSSAQNASFIAGICCLGRKMSHRSGELLAFGVAAAW
jgi:hypothetical protein